MSILFEESSGIPEYFLIIYEEGYIVKETGLLSRNAVDDIYGSYKDVIVNCGIEALHQGLFNRRNFHFSETEKLHKLVAGEFGKVLNFPILEHSTEVLECEGVVYDADVYYLVLYSRTESGEVSALCKGCSLPELLSAETLCQYIAISISDGHLNILFVDLSLKILTDGSSRTIQKVYTPSANQYYSVLGQSKWWGYLKKEIEHKNECQLSELSARLQKVTKAQLWYQYNLGRIEGEYLS